MSVYFKMQTFQKIKLNFKISELPNFRFVQILSSQRVFHNKHLSKKRENYGDSAFSFIAALNNRKRNTTALNNTKRNGRVTNCSKKLKHGTTTMKIKTLVEGLITIRFEFW